MMPRQLQPGLLNLPLDLLARILAFLTPETQPRTETQGLLERQQCEAISVCKGLWQARDVLPFNITVTVTAAKLQHARETGHEAALLGFLARKAPILHTTTLVAVDQQSDLERVLPWLAGVRKLDIKLAIDGKDPRFTFPKALGQLTTLTHLSLVLHSRLDSAELNSLSSLTALQSLSFAGSPSAGFPPQAFQALCRLTSLELEDLGWGKPHPQLTAAHLSACTALRRLCLPSTTQQLQLQLPGPAAFQHLEELEVALGLNDQHAASWRVLPMLPCLRRLRVEFVSGELSAVLRECLPACVRLASLQLSHYTEPVLPGLPSTLTCLTLNYARALKTLPITPSMRSLRLVECSELLEGPAQSSALTQLTSLTLECPKLVHLPDWVAALPALQVLQLAENYLRDLPELRCLSSLRQLVLYRTYLHCVPPTLAGAPHLSRLVLAGNLYLDIDRRSLDTLCSLPALEVLAVSSCKGVEREDLDFGVFEFEEGEEDYVGYVGWSMLRDSLPAAHIIDLYVWLMWEYIRPLVETIEDLDS